MRLGKGRVVRISDEDLPETCSWLAGEVELLIGVRSTSKCDLSIKADPLLYSDRELIDIEKLASQVSIDRVIKLS